MSNALTEQEKLLRVISKATLEGWDKQIAAGFIQIIPEMFTDEYPDAKDSMLRSVLLSHDFAAAFWGNKTHCYCDGTPNSIIHNDEAKSEDCESCGVPPKKRMKDWEHRLQQAVLADDIINYYYLNGPVV